MRFTMNQKSPDRESPNRSDLQDPMTPLNPGSISFSRAATVGPPALRLWRKWLHWAFLFVQPVFPANFLFQKHFAPTAPGIAALPESEPTSETRLQNAASRA